MQVFASMGGFFVVKAATGFYKKEPEEGFSHAGGAFLLFSKRNSELRAILRDEVYLTRYVQVLRPALPQKLSSLKA